MKSVAISLLLVVLAGTAWYFGRPQPAPTATATTPPPALTVAKTTASKEAPAAKPYPFSTSVVSGKPLGSKDQIVKFTQDGYEIKLASQDEATEFHQNPAIYLAKITEAYKTAKPCPMTVCPVMGDPLDADAYSFVYEGREFKFCCDGCLDDFEKNPAKFVKMWDDAEKTAQSAKK